MAEAGHPFVRAPTTGKRIAVVGAGPAGLACAHRLAMLGHEVVLIDAREKGGGLNEFGIAAYKAVDGFAQAEVAWLLGIGGIAVEYGRRLGRDVALTDLAADYDAVFLGIGLGGVSALEAGGRGDGGRAAGGRVHRRAAPGGGSRGAAGRAAGVVIGGGMTAIDAGVQARSSGRRR